MTVLLDDHVSIEDDLDHSGTEARYRVIGTSDRGRLLMVVLVELGDDTARIISARRATKRGRDEHEDG